MHILIADDHELILEGLRDTLQSLFPGAYLHLAHNAQAALDIVAEVPEIQLLLTDLFMPDMDGFTFLRTVCNAHPELTVVVLSASENSIHIQKSVDIGVSGYIPKCLSRDEIAAALNLILDGGIFVPHSSTKKSDEQTTNLLMPSREHIEHSLTPRQRDILKSLASGKSNKLIARELNLSQNTVKVHVSAILKILNLSNRSQACILAEKIGLF